MRSDEEAMQTEENRTKDSGSENHRDSVQVGDPRVPRKFIRNWRQACDRTKDRTKELLKRWRTLPESETIDMTEVEVKQHGWSVHVWSTWLTRGSLEDEETDEQDSTPALSAGQTEKFSHFFTHLLDWDRDEVISSQDFEALAERLRHFADWSSNSTEFHMLLEVQRGFVDTFIPGGDSLRSTASLTQWLQRWGTLVHGATSLLDFPLWLRYFAKIVFQVINTSGSGVISRDELRVFYSSFLGLDTQKVGETLDVAYNSMTSNGDHLLKFSVFNLCFANFLLGRFPHGPGQFLFGPFENSAVYSALFPIDYSALNSTPHSLEPYSPHRHSNRHSVVV